MNPIIPIAIVGIVFYSLSSKKKSTSTNSCEWICYSPEELDFFKQVSIHQEKMNNVIKNLGNNITIKNLALETLKITTKCELNKNSTLTIKFLWASHLLSAAYYLLLNNIITLDHFSEWIYNEYPTELVSYNLMKIGNYELETIKSRFEVSDSEIYDVIQLLISNFPQFKKFGPKFVTEFIILSVSQIITVKEKENCVKITYLKYADYTGLSGNLNSIFITQYERIFAIATKALM